VAFLSPFALWLLPLAALPYVLHRPDRPVRPRTVSALRLWTAAAPHEIGRPSRRVRVDMLTIVQSLSLVALIGALARPSVRAPQADHVFIVDVSASMAARSATTDRLGDARAAMARQLRLLPSRARVRLLAAGSTATDRGAFAADDPRLRQQIDALRAGATRMDVADALRRAVELEPTATVWVFSDARLSTANSMRWTTVGAPAPNVAITALDAFASDDPLRSDLVVQVSNYSAARREAALDVRSGVVPVLHERVQLEAYETRTVVRPIPARANALEAAITTPDDALALDNTRYAVPRASRVTVQLTSSGNFFLEQALRSNPTLNVVMGPPVSGVDAPKADVIVCDGCRSLPLGDAPVLVVPSPSTSADTPITVDDASHPIAAGLDVNAVAVRPTAPWSLDPADVVVRAGATPVVTAHDDGRRRIVAINADMRSSGFVTTPAFPVLVANAINWLSGRHDRTRNIVAGEPLHWVLRDDVNSVEIRDPAGRTQHLSLVDHTLAIVPEVPGIYVVRAGDEDVLFAVNADTREESDLSRPVTLQPEAVRPGARASTRAQTDLSGALLLGAALLLVSEWRLAKSSGRRVGSPLRLAAAGALAVAFLGVRVPFGRATTAVMFAVDESESIPVASQQTASQFIARASAGMRTGDVAGLVAFGSDAVVVRRPSTGARLQDAHADVSAEGTNIEAALRTARRSLPDEGMRRVVLLSDGNQTQGNALREATLAAAAGVAIDVLPMATGAATTRIRDLRAPQEVRTGEPFLLSATIDGPPGANVELRVRSNEAEETTHQVQIGARGTTILDMPRQEMVSGTYTFLATLSDDITGAGTAVTVTGPPALLYVTSHIGDSRPVPFGNFNVESTPPGGLPVDTARLARFAAVVLDDVAGDTLSPAAAASLKRYVEGGGGLMVIGSPSSLTPGGYQNETVDSLLPVDLRVRPGSRAPVMGFVLVVDKSGSMSDRSGGLQKMEMARQAVLKALEAIPPHDSLGVIAFDAKPVDIATLAPAQNQHDLPTALRRIEPGGSTAIAPAVERAVQWLQAAPVQRRHILLVSDGRSSAADLNRVADAAKDSDVEVSIIAIGEDADRSALTALAGLTGGRAYFPDDLRQLPALAARDAVQSRGDTTVEESFTMRAPLPHPILAGVNRSQLPSLHGYVISAARPGADTILLSHLDDPLLAAWRLGLGRVAVFTSDLRTAWTTLFRHWAGFAPLWMQTLTWISRRSSSQLVTDLLETSDGILAEVDVNAAPHGSSDIANVTAHVRGPDGDVRDVLMTPAAPGRFEGRVPGQQTGTYVLDLSARTGHAEEELRVVRAMYWSSQREHQAQGVNRSLLAHLAALTGGRQLAPGESPFAGPRPMVSRSTRSLMIVLAISLCLAQIGLPSIRGTFWPQRHPRLEAPAA
jgi:Mg-chelatase subunit ChlD